MSDKMFNEVPVVGTKYKFGDWKLYAVHNEQVIKGFFGDYRWLSNFWETPVYFEGLIYDSSECAFQASKLAHIEDRKKFASMSGMKPAQSKKEWKKYSLLDKNTEEWDLRKYDVMSIILFDKFYRNIELRMKLIETGDKFLEETNHWSDCWWGVDIKKGGLNNLGEILMKIRNFWK
jgi:ribA/ribD-fused uncharacterized protein